MAEIDRPPFSPLEVFFLIIFAIESIVSLLGNGFVLAVNGHSWLHSKKILPCDFLLALLSLSRFLLQWIVMAGESVYFSSLETYINSEKQQVIAISWTYLNTASLWCATWLNIFYCVKVTNFAHPFFIWLKLRIGMLAPRLLGITLLTFMLCSIHSVMEYFENKKCHNLTGNLPENTSQSEDLHSDSLTSLNNFHIYFAAINFSICLTASFVLLLSLWRHKRNLKKGGLSPQDLSTRAHLRVMKPLLFSLIFYILHIAAMNLILAKVFQYGTPEQLICVLLLVLYPSAHSIILIFTNPKLRKLCAHVLNLRRSASR